MKKRLFCILALLLVLTLCGCDTAASTSNSTETTTAPTAPTILSENADGETVSLEYDMAIPVTFLSDFTLYLNNDMTLVAMDAADENGKSLLEGLEFAGKPYAEGIGLVLKNAYDQGKFTHNEKMQFTFPSEIISGSLMEALFMPVIQFVHDNKVYVRIDWDVIPIEEPDFEANYLYGLQKIKEDDQTIYVEKAQWIHPTAGGQTVYSYFTEFPNPAVYELGSLLIGSNLDQIRIKMLYFNEDGSSSINYFKDFKLDKTIDFQEEKVTICEYQNGILARLISKDALGLFIENGILSIGCDEDGTQFASTYHSNGNVATSAEYRADGSFHLWTYDENNNPIHWVTTSADGTYSESEFENGQEVYQKTVNPDGTYMEGRFENGNWTYTEGIIEPTDPANE